MRVIANVLLVFVVGFFLLPAESKLFNNSYVSFDIPENWKCKSFGTDWVCHSTLSRNKKEAMIILTAKEAGVLDNFQQYQNFLNTPRQNKDSKNKPFISKVLHSKKVIIHNQAWVDGFHRGSEIPSYYTRYLVTVCCNNSPTKLAILVTYSAHKNHYTKYATSFLKSIRSLRVINSKNFGKIKGLQSGESMGSVAGYMEGILEEEEEVLPEGGFLSTPFGKEGLIGLLVALLGAGSYIAVRRRRKRKKDKKGSHSSSSSRKRKKRK